MSTKSDLISKEAIICFIDIVDSSYYGKLVTDNYYYDTIKNFERLSNRILACFYPQTTPVDGIKKEIRGDELLITIIPSLIGKPPTTIIEMLIAYCFIVKFVLNVKYKIDIACGIHVGNIIYETDQSNGDNSKFRIYGHNINYAKRLETSSREGFFSKIMISKNVVEITDDIPLVRHEHVIEFKGIGPKEYVYEVKTGFLSFDAAYNLYDEMIKIFGNKIPYECMPKILKFSFYNFIIEHNDIDGRIKEDIQKRLEKGIWSDINEVDPIVHFLRAKTLESQGNYTDAFYYYRKVLGGIPTFIGVKKLLVSIVNKVVSCIDCQYSMIDIVEIKIMADEFLHKFDFLLDSVVTRYLPKGICT